MFAFTDNTFGLSKPFAKYLALTACILSAAALSISTLSFGSYLVPCKAKLSDSVQGCDVPPLSGERAQSTISTPASMIKTRFDGSMRAYLDWICVLKSYRHRGVAQTLLKELCNVLKERGIASLVGLTASNEEAQKFYRSIPNSIMRDIGIWIDIE